MISATLKGRLQTKILTFAIAGPIAVLFAYFDLSLAYIVMFLMLIVVGLSLEAIWSTVVEYESGWKTFLFAGLEFGLIYTLIRVFDLDVLLTYDVAFFDDGLRYYLTAFAATQLFLIYILPIWHISWADQGGELWQK